MSGRRIGITLAIAACIGFISYAIYAGQFVPFVSSAAGIAWRAFKISFFSILLISAFLLLHPLTFMLQLRGTPAGQRGHVRFSHLFGLLWLDAGGDRNAQKVRLGIWRWSWRIAGKDRERAPRRKTPPPPPSPAPTPTPHEKTLEPSPPVKSPTIMEGTSPAPDAAPRPDNGKQTAPKPSEMKPSEMKQPEPAVDTAPAAVEKMPTEPSEVEPLSPDIAEETMPLPPEAPSLAGPAESPFPGAYAKETEAPREKPFGEKIRADLRRLRRRAADGWRKAKTWLNLGRRVWRRASPMIRRLASDHWTGMHMLPSVCRVHYGLPEAHLTGLTQGLAAPFAGLLRPFSIHLEPIPVFTGSTVHVFIRGGVFIQPWRILWAWIILLTTIDLWKAMRDLWRWHKARAATPKKPEQ